MTKPIKLGLASLVAAIMLAPAAQAQMSYYAGAGLAYSDVLSLRGGGTNVNDGNSGGLVGLGLTTGVRLDAANVFYGAELDMDFNVGGALTANATGAACADGSAVAPYMCAQDATLRARAMIGTDIKGFEVFGTLGYAVLYGQQAIAPDGTTADITIGGLTYGVGAQRAFGIGKLRAELIRDELDTNVSAPLSGAPSWEATTVKLSYLVAF